MTRVEQAVQAAARGLKAYEYFMDQFVPRTEKLKYIDKYECGTGTAWEPVGKLMEQMTADEIAEFITILDEKVAEIDAKQNARKRDSDAQ